MSRLQDALFTYSLIRNNPVNLAVEFSRAIASAEPERNADSDQPPVNYPKTLPTPIDWSRPASNRRSGIDPWAPRRSA